MTGIVDDPPHMAGSRTEDDIRGDHDHIPRKESDRVLDLEIGSHMPRDPERDTLTPPTPSGRLVNPGDGHVPHPRTGGGRGPIPGIGGNRAQGLEIEEDRVRCLLTGGSHLQGQGLERGRQSHVQGHVQDRRKMLAMKGKIIHYSLVCWLSLSSICRNGTKTD